jgi:hypothetical protein
MSLTPSLTNKTVIDNLFAEHSIPCQFYPAIVAPEELVHVVGAQEPIRDQPDARARMLLTAGWLKVENVRTELSDSERTSRVTAVQQAARAWLKQAAEKATPADREQVRWVVEKTRSYESKQQIAQRIWLALVLYSVGCRGLVFDSEGRIHWEGGLSGRIGISPDAALDLAWSQTSHQIYAGSFRQPDGTITRGKGRHRWHVYRLTVDAAAAPLFERHAKQVNEKVALIVASETYATTPQLPRDFYGGDAFQQACIDAQDQQFDHILVLSPAHGVISLDDIVPSEQPWDEVLERRIWAWQMLATQRLGKYLFGEPEIPVPDAKDVNWWAWLNPASQYEFTLFGGGFAVRIFTDYLLQSHSRMPNQWPKIILDEWRPGYHVGDFDDDFGFDIDTDEDYDEDFDIETALQDIDQLLEWASEFVELVNIYVPPTSETWELAADEALIPIRLLTDMGMDIEDLLDLLTDITLLIEHPLPMSLLISASMVVSVLLQITHSLVHNEREAIPEMLSVFPESVLRQYIENAMQETNQEDQLCACLTLAEQMQLIALAIPPAINDQIVVWLQTYISARMRHRLLDDPNSQQTFQ